MTPPLSPRTSALVQRLFLPEEQSDVNRLVTEECGNNLPFCETDDEFKLERIRFSVLRLSVGDLNELQKAVKVAKSDWRDSLVASGFGSSLTAHSEWADATLKENPAPFVLVLTGLSGSGKTTVGAHLARELGWMLIEGDTHHSRQNFTAFLQGQEISEEAMQLWLSNVRAAIDRYIRKKLSLILTATTLKESEREALCVNNDVHLVYLHGTPAQLEKHQKQRTFKMYTMERLAYQLAHFEEPRNAQVVEINQPPELIAAAIRNMFQF